MDQYTCARIRIRRRKREKIEKEEKNIM